MKLESSATSLSGFWVGDGLFAKPRKIKYTIPIEVLFKALVLLTESIKTLREWVGRFESATCTSELSDREKRHLEHVYHLKKWKESKNKKDHLL